MTAAWDLMKAIVILWGSTLMLGVLLLVMFAPVIALGVFFVRMLWRL